ncbi:MAG: hypothetical protein AABY58_04085 [Nitrospirota bacterium]
MSKVLLSEILARFILTKKYIRQDKTVRWNAFMPHKGETSVFRVSGISDIEIWHIGEKYVVSSQNKPLFGRADITASIIMDNGLDVIPQEPPVKHANIIGWPEDKSKQMEMAMQLALKAQFHKKD